MSRFFYSRLPGKRDLAAVCLAALAAFLLWNHPDIQETALHTRIFLDDLFSGRFFRFYEDSMAMKTVYGYANAAHYHIVFYLICAVWDLPVYLAQKLLGENDFAFMLWTKALGVTAFALCGFAFKRLAARYLPDTRKAWTPWLIWLCPAAFFGVLCMGQYDSLCILVILLALPYWLDGDLLRFALVMGLAMVFKMFALFLIIPLVLLREKRLLRAAGYIALSMWLYLPGLFLFRGRDGDAGFFNGLIADRLFTGTLPAVGDPSVVLIGLALLFAGCWCARLSDQRMQQAMPWLCAAVFGWLFLFVQWHPQWLILLLPFLLLTALQAKNQTFWWWMQLIVNCGFFVLIAYQYPGQLESNLFDLGLLGQFGLLVSAQPLVRTSTIYFDLIPYLSQLAPVAFCAPILAAIIGQFPTIKGQLADRLGGGYLARPPMQIPVYGIFAASFGIWWLAPVLFGWCKTMGLL